MKFPFKKYKTVRNYYSDYIQTLNKTLIRLDVSKLEKVAKLIEDKIKKKNNIFLCGNGGSAAIANHYIADFLKLLRTNTNLIPKFHSLTSNMELITAISNDIKYDKIFSYQLESLAKKNDLLILISASGNSKNLKNAIIAAKKIRLSTISFVGFDGGYLKKNSNIFIHANIKNYGISEDVFHIVMHVLVQFLRQRYLKKKIIEIKF